MRHGRIHGITVFIYLSVYLFICCVKSSYETFSYKPGRLRDVGRVQIFLGRNGSSTTTCTYKPVVWAGVKRWGWRDWAQTIAFVFIPTISFLQVIYNLSVDKNTPPSLRQKNKQITNEEFTRNFTSD